MSRTRSGHWATAVEAEYGQPIEDIIRDEVESGHSSQQEMCEDFKCTRGQLQYLCRKLGISLSAKPLSDEQKRAKADAGRKSRAIRKDALMATLNGEKVTLRHAAAMVGVCYETARRNVKRYGITPDEALKIPPMTPHEYGKKGARARWGAA